MIKSVAVFGASSKTGECVVEAAIQKGMNVRVLLSRHTAQLKGSGKTVEVVVGGVVDIQDVKTVVEGQDAVVVLLGSSGNQDTSTVTCEGLKNIIAVMESLYVKVFSIYFPVSGNTGRQSTQEPNEAVDHNDYIHMTRVIEFSNLHWVSVVAPCVTDDPPTGYFIVRDRTIGRHAPLTRRDLAAFLIDCLSMPERYQKTVHIESYAKR